MRCEHRIVQEPVEVIAGLRSRRAPGIFGTPQEAVAPACLTQMVLRGAAPQRGAKKHAALRGGSEMPAMSGSTRCHAGRLLPALQTDTVPHAGRKRSDVARLPFGTPQVAVAPAYLTQMVLRRAAPQRRAKKHAALRGGSEMPRLVCCRISQTHYLESARFSAAHTGHFRPVAIPAITRTARRGEPRGLTTRLNRVARCWATFNFASNCGCLQ